MSQGPELAACPLFNDRRKGIDGMVSLFEKRCCTDDFERCAR